MLEIEPYMLPLANHSGEQPAKPDSSAQRLADLFESSLSISEHLNDKLGALNPPRPLQQQQQQQQTDHNPVRYHMSQHYHHSTHGTSLSSSSRTQHAAALHPLQQQQQQPNHNYNDNSLRLLTQNDIPPSSLLRSQLALFEQSSPDAQQKLIMLWRLAPPTYARNGGQELADRLGEYQSITLEQEEELTWLRYQRNFARTADVRTTVQAEQLCGKQSLLGGYLEDSSLGDGGDGSDGTGAHGEAQRNGSRSVEAVEGGRKDEDGDEEML